MNRTTLCLLDAENSQDSSSELSNFASTKRQTSRLTRIINLWHERSKQRRQLLELADDPDLLKDLGLSNYDLQHEGRKPFWRR